MFGNIISFLVLAGLMVLFGWLTYRAVRAQRLWVKIVGGLVGGLFTLILLAVIVLAGKGFATIYAPDDVPAPDLTVAGTPEQVARGEYLVNLSCIGCHGAVGADGNPTGEQPLSGGWNISAAEGFGFAGDMVTENLTPGGKLAEYSDGELFRVLRHGLNQDGDLLAFMPLLPYAQLSDADTEAIIAYLRSLPPVETTGPTGDNLFFVGAIFYGAGMFGTPAPGASTVSAPPEGTTAEYGKYVATFGECRGCHGPDVTGSPATSVSAAVPNPRPLVAELSQEQFFEMMRSGIKPDGTPFPETMPWQNAAKMTDDDLTALYAYLTAPTP
ncbi:MAG: c-type cytochrome [Chloroflexi bacterium]|nr:c-type cytochrome [Chloroflexota bacterium]MBP8059136.1 c-type cytochrome [Chloroflexota bacterium]